MKKRPFFLDFLNLNLRDPNNHHPPRSSRMDHLNLHSNSDDERSKKMGDNDNHEYHEISDEEINSPAFDFGPSLMDEVFKELDIIKPEPRGHDNNHHDSSATIDCSNNVKNEIKEIASKFSLGSSSSKDGRRKQGTVKPISAADSQSLESAIAMAKELASRSIMELDCRNDNIGFECPSSADSPKTPNSPNKKSSTTKFSFKFRNSPKAERRHFSDEQEKRQSDGIESIILNEAKEAYEVLVERRPSSSDTRGASHEPRFGERRLSSSSSSTTGHNHSRQVSQESADFDLNRDAINPLRLLRNGVNVMPKVRGNKQRIASTPQTASLARLTSTVSSHSGPSRSGLGTPPPPPVTTNHDPANPLPLPPRDRNNQILKVPLKHHQRKHPLLIPQIVPANGSADSLPAADGGVGDNHGQSLSTFKPHGPVLKQVSCPEAPASYLHSISIDPQPKSSQGKVRPAIPPPPKLTPKVTEVSFESEISDAIENLDSLKSFVSERLSNGSNGKANGQKAENGSPASIDEVDKASMAPVPTPRNRRGKSPDSDDIRVMQMVLANEVQLLAEECVDLLKKTGGDVHKAIKCVRLREMLKSHSITLDCNWIETLEKYKWNVRQASNYLIATQGLPESSEV